MASVTSKEKYTPFSPMLSFLRVLSIFGGFPLTPLSYGNLFNDTRLSNVYDDRHSTRASRIDEKDPWDNFYAFEVQNLKLAWCYIWNTFLWLFLLLIFLAISYGNEYSGAEFLFPLNVTSR